MTDKDWHSPEDTVRLSVNIAGDVADALVKIAARHDVPITEAVRQAISMLAYFTEADQRGAAVLLRERDGTNVQVEFPRPGQERR